MADRLVLWDVRLIDGTGAPAREHQAIVVAEGRIVDLGPIARARGDARADSDLDVAVLPEGGNPEAGADPDGPILDRDLRIRIAVALAELAPDGRVDVVLLDRAPDTLRQKVMVDGRMIFCRDLPRWKALRVATMKEYGDREWARKIYREALKKRLEQRGNGGRSVDRH